MNTVTHIARGDRRPPLVRLLDDITALRYMATVVNLEVDRSFDTSRAIKKHNGDCDASRGWTFYFSSESIDLFHFKACDLEDRANAIEHRARLMFDPDYEGQLAPQPENPAPVRAELPPIATRRVDETPAAPAKAPATAENQPVALSDTWDRCNEIESALAMLDGFVKAVHVLSDSGGKPEKRLAAICAIAGPIQDEIEKAGEALRVLYDAARAG